VEGHCAPVERRTLARRWLAYEANKRITRHFEQCKESKEGPGIKDERYVGCRRVVAKIGVVEFASINSNR
jgi:hypothetical protein